MVGNILRGVFVVNAANEQIQFTEFISLSFMIYERCYFI